MRCPKCEFICGPPGIVQPLADYIPVAAASYLKGRHCLSEQDFHQVVQDLREIYEREGLVVPGSDWKIQPGQLLEPINFELGTVSLERQLYLPFHILVDHDLLQQIQAKFGEQQVSEIKLSYLPSRPLTKKDSKYGDVELFKRKVRSQPSEELKKHKPLYMIRPQHVALAPGWELREACGHCHRQAGVKVPVTARSWDDFFPEIDFLGQINKGMTLLSERMVEFLKPYLKDVVAIPMTFEEYLHNLAEPAHDDSIASRYYKWKERNGLGG